MKRCVLAGLAVVGCAHARIVDDSSTVNVPAGAFTMGSDAVDRGQAADLSVRAGTFGRGTVDSLAAELPAQQVELDAFAIMRTPVTQADYHAFVLDSGAPEPFVDAQQWAAANTGYAYDLVKAALWRAGAPDPERVDHPAVLVTRDEAAQYCAWWGRRVGGRGALPGEAQWEKAARGTDARRFPWGDAFRPAWSSSAESGRVGTSPVDAHPAGASPYGALEMSGNVLEWTATAWPDRDGHYVVKGGSFNADAAAARCAARHARPESSRHPALGFRCVLEPRPDPTDRDRHR